MQSLIKAYQLVYEDMTTPIRKALHLYGRFDQLLLLPQQSRDKGQELAAQIEFLDTGLTAIIDRDFS